jgi:hypothetical protein
MTLPESVQVLDVRDSRSSGPAPRGVAVVDGPSGRRILDLADPAHVAVLLEHLDGEVSAEAVADIVSRYARGGDGPHHVLVGGAEDLPGLLPDDVRAAFDLHAPTVVRGPGGERAITFLTCFVRPEPPDGALRVGIDRWSVRISPSGSVAWTSCPHARALESPRYAAAEKR